jgi:hypothetical protein
MLTASPRVIYQKSTSDVSLRIVLDRASRILGRTIVVHSGDRDFRPKGSPSKSLHLAHRAVDLHVPHLSAGQLFHDLLEHKAEIFESAVESYQVIHHGIHTETEAEHVHVGHYHMIKAMVTGPGISFWLEGMTPNTKGRYSKLP